MSNIKKLYNSELDSNGRPISVLSTATTVNYSTNFKHGSFFSITYHFGLSKATNSGSSTLAAPAATTPAPGRASPGGSGKRH